jgi:NADP-dependent 3-hydroxy acid dehydrogenase YdfG
MKQRLLPLERQVIVVTGASSGIGLATARMAAEAGAKVVLVSRNAEALARIAGDIRARGGEAIDVVADVGNEADVEAAAVKARAVFGSLDTWVNNAGVAIWGRLDEVDMADSRRLFETNFWGVVHGSRAALKLMREAGGAIINVGSIAGERAYPLQGIYCASKHAVRAFTEALRMEIEADGTPVSVTLVKPASVGTPIVEHARNYMDRGPRLPSPLYRPEEVANAILHAAAHPIRDIYIGAAARMIVAAANGAPRLFDLLGEQLLFAAQKQEAGGNRADNLHQPGEMAGVVHHDPEERPMHRSLYTRAVLHPGATGAAVAAAGLGLALLLGRRSERARQARH